MVRQDYSWAGPEPNVFYARRAGRYYDFSGASGIDRAEDSRAFGFLDFDGDGNVDLVLKSRMGPQIRLFQNECGQGRQRLVISLRGTKSNRDAIGARVEVDGQVKWVVAGSAYLSQHTKRLHFGLGDRRARGEGPHRLALGTRAATAAARGRIPLPDHRGKRSPCAQALKPAAPGLVSTPEPRVDNRARPFTTWLWEPVPLPEKRRGPALLVLHAGEALPAISRPHPNPGSAQRRPADLAAAYAIFRRYLFDYRVDLATPLWMLIDTAGRVRKIYAESPGCGHPRRPTCERWTGPFPTGGRCLSKASTTASPRATTSKSAAHMWMAGYGEQALPYLEEASRRSPTNAKTLLAIGRIHLEANRLGPAREAVEKVTAARSQLAGGLERSGRHRVRIGQRPGSAAHV